MADQYWVIRDLHRKVYEDVEPRLKALEVPPVVQVKKEIWTEARSSFLAKCFILLMLLIILPTEKLMALAELWKATRQ